jgi:hypothetical protein
VDATEVSMSNLWRWSHVQCICAECSDHHVLQALQESTIYSSVTTDKSNSKTDEYTVSSSVNR